MNIGVLGSGGVGRRLATALVANGHDVMIGSRSADNENCVAWVSDTGDGAHRGTFADAAAFGDVVLLAVAGEHAVPIVTSAAAGLAGKVLIDVTNPLDFSRGFPPRLFVSNDDSLSEQLQRALPDTRVIKALNTVANHLMVAPARLAGGDHSMLIAGDDADAKAVVSGLLRDAFGWTDVIDMGDLTNARALEAWLLMWTRLYKVLGTGDFSLKIVR